MSANALNHFPDLLKQLVAEAGGTVTESGDEFVLTHRNGDTRRGRYKAERGVSRIMAAYNLLVQEWAANRLPLPPAGVVPQQTRYEVLKVRGLRAMLNGEPLAPEELALFSESEKAGLAELGISAGDAVVPVQVYWYQTIEAGEMDLSSLTVEVPASIPPRARYAWAIRLLAARRHGEIAARHGGMPYLFDVSIVEEGVKGSMTQEERELYRVEAVNLSMRAALQAMYDRLAPVINYAKLSADLAAKFPDLVR